SQTTLRIGAVLGTIGAIAVLAASVRAATSKPAGMSQPEYRALTIRSEALNKLYGNAVTRLSPQQFKKLYQAGGNRMAPQELVAQPTGSGNGFDWGDFGIGAAAMLGLVLLSGGLLAGAHFGRKIGVRPRPLQ